MADDGVTVLLTGIGLDGGPDIIRALRADPELGARVVGVDASPDQAGRHLCDAFELVPMRDDPGYVDAVASVAEAKGARVIYPLPTFDQEIFAEAQPGLEARGFAVCASPLASVRTCNDKWLLYEHLREAVPEVAPRTTRVLSADKLERDARGLGYPEDRVCIRRRVSRGGIGFRILDSGPSRLDALLGQGPSSALSSIEEVLDVLSQAEDFPEYLVQEYLPGDEIDVDVLCRNGESIVVAPRRNLAMSGGAATHSVLEGDDDIDGLSRRIVAELGLGAVVNLAFRADSGGTPKLLEINPRIPQSVLCALGGGVNLVALSVRQALGESIEPAQPGTGAALLRYTASVVTDPAGTAVIGDR